MLELGQRLGSRYLIQEELYGGRFFNVWLAEDKELQRLVAVKTVREQSADSLLREEALQMAQLEHPYLIPVYDTGIENERFYLVMRYISNISLSDILRTQQLDLQTVFRLAQRLAEALDYLHDRGFIHSNFKSSNVMMDEQSEPFIGNFLMRYMSSDERIVTAQTGDLGTVYNIAPEIFLGKATSRASDVYSFGLLIHHCLTGELVLGRHQAFAEMQLKSDAILPTVRQFRSELPLSVDIILRRLTHRDAEHRYSRVGQAVEDLQQSLFSEQDDINGKIFVSYARKDSDYVHNLAQELRRIGLDIWIDQDIEPGTNWDDAIQDALDDCDMMLLITTESSMSSEYVTHEWSYFMGAGKSVYPFIPQAPIPKNIHPRLSRVQHVVGTDDMLSNVARIVDVLAGGNPSKLADKDG